jgi:hypothetical protein
MSPSGEETALAVMDDDGWGSAITTAPVTLARLTAYLNAKHRYEDLVSIWGRTTAPGAPVPAVIREAGARVDALKAAGGYGGPDDPPCCQRYGFLHEPGFSQAGCRLPATAVSWQWPAGKTFGELSPAERIIATRRAARQLQAELERAAPAITEIMNTETEQEGK